MVSLSSSEKDATKSRKKRLGFFSRSKTKTNKQNKEDSLEVDNKEPDQRRRRSAVVNELEDRVQFDSQDFSSAKRNSKGSLIALAYRTTSKNSQESQKAPTSVPVAASNANEETESGKSGWFSFLNITGSSFFRKICDDVFDTIDVDRSGKINDSELYQGLLLIHLKLGMYFGPAACKPISLDRTKCMFNKLDTNRDGSLDKVEFRRVLALLMGNVVSRILFQFICTLLVVPLAANTILQSSLDGYSYGCGIVMEYKPLIEVALGWDLITKYTSIATATATDIVGKFEILDVMEGPAQFLTEKYDTFVLKPLREIPQEKWGSLPLTFLSTILALIIVPYSILKTDDFFQFLANRFGKK